MTSLQLFWLVIGGGWALLELAIAFKTRVSLSQSQARGYRSERIIWLGILLALSAALTFKQLKLTPLPLAEANRQWVAICLVGLGLGIRGTAMFTLGRLFSTTVNIQQDHRLIITGPYRYMRHPAYTGLLLSFLGAGIAMGDFLGLLSLMTPIFLVLQRRIQVEERWLEQHFPETYSAYCLRTKQWLPWLY